MDGFLKVLGGVFFAIVLFKVLGVENIGTAALITILGFTAYSISLCFRKDI